MSGPRKTRREKDAASRAAAPALGVPSFEGRSPLPLAEVPVPPQIEACLIGPGNSYVRSYRLGACGVLVTREGGRWHLSISHRCRYPSWDEIAEARYRLLPADICAAMILPPRGAYINLHENCFHVYEIDDPGTMP